MAFAQVGDGLTAGAAVATVAAAWHTAAAWVIPVRKLVKIQKHELDPHAADALQRSAAVVDIADSAADAAAADVAAACVAACAAADTAASTVDVLEGY